MGVCVKSGDIVSYNGPFPCGGFPDLKIFRLGMKWNLGAGEKVIADRGYRGDLKVFLPDHEKDRDTRKAIDRARSRHESINSRLKKWGCHKETFRHSRNKHHIIFRAVIVIEQLSIENGRAPFQVTTYSDTALIQIPN